MTDDENKPSIIPAQPGFFLITVATADDEDFWYDLEPIIAWQISQYKRPKNLLTFASAAPIAAGNSHECENDQAILCPDGTVIEVETRNFKTLDEWKTYAQERWGNEHRQMKSAS